MLLQSMSKSNWKGAHRWKPQVMKGTLKIPKVPHNWSVHGLWMSPHTFFFCTQVNNTEGPGGACRRQPHREDWCRGAVGEALPAQRICPLLYVGAPL